VGCAMVMALWGGGGGVINKGFGSYYKGAGGFKGEKIGDSIRRRRM
jgi:hypothetical protein